MKTTLAIALGALGLSSAVLIFQLTSGGPMRLSQEKLREVPLKILIGTTGLAPYLEHTPAEILATVNGAVLGQLIETDENFDLRPSLLKSWKWDYSRKAFLLELRDDLYFHSGRKATSADLEFSLVRGFFSKMRNFYRIYLGNIDGIDNVPEGAVYRSGAVSGVRVLDVTTVEVRVKDPNPSFIHSLIHAYFSLVPIEELNSDYISWRRYPIGAGPYKVMEPGFQNGCLKLELVETKSSERARFVDLYTVDQGDGYDVLLHRSETTNIRGFEPIRTSYPGTVVNLFFSNLNPLSRIPEFRLALNLAVDRTRLAQTAPLYFEPATQMLPSHFWGRAQVPDPYNSEKARSLLRGIDQALLDKTWKVPVFSGKVFPPEYSAFFQELSLQLEAVGVHLEFFPSQEKFPSRETATATPVTVFGMVSDYIDPLIMLALREIEWVKIDSFCNFRAILG